MKKIILTEKPSVARDIARVLNIKKPIDGGFESNDYVITYALGHLITLKTPEEMNPNWVNWTLETLPMLPSKFETTVIKDTSRQFRNVQNILGRKDCSELIIATDAGREGELVARWIIEKSRCKLPLKRLWISSMTDQAIRNGFNSLKNANDYINLYKSAYARSIADWLIGLNATRALTCLHNASLSCGRVQTPTLQMVVSREKEIDNFTPEKYYKIIWKIDDIEFVLFNNSETCFKNIDQAYLTITEIKKYKPVLKRTNKAIKKDYPPLLYDLGSLQQDANKIYGYSPKETLNIMQSLYERHHVLTYPRTDSKYLTKDLHPLIKERMLIFLNSDYKKYVNDIINKPICSSSRIFCDQKVSDHHAIIPTEQKPNFHEFNQGETNIYNLVLKRFILVFMDECLYETENVEICLGNYKFLGKTTNVIKQGYRELSGKMETSSLNDQSIYGTGNIKAKEFVTSPKERFTEATLLNAMEHPSKYVEDAKYKKILEDTQGIGTPATRADIMEKLFNMSYLEIKNKHIYSTSKGRQLVELVPSDLKSPLLTAKFELSLQKISVGSFSFDNFVSEIKVLTVDILKQILSTKTSYKHDNMIKQKCPLCGGILLSVENKVGKRIVCNNSTCSYKKQVYFNTRIRCPKCHKQMIEYESQNGKVLECPCGYKELKEKFFDNIKQVTNKVNKSDLNKVLKNQEKEIPANNPFKDFFEK